MDQAAVLDADGMRAAFADRGVVRLDGAFGHDEARRVHDAVWRYAERKAGIRLDDTATWPAGWMPISWKSLKSNRALGVMLQSPMVRSALDAIFAETGWEEPKPGAQVLVTMPTDGPWVLPDGWHMDGGFERPAWPVFGVKLFGFFGEVGPCGGGTMLLEGSHQLVDRYRATFDQPPAAGKENWHPFLRRHPPLGELLRGASKDDGGRSMVGSRYDVDGIPVDVVELCGSPGDVVITHLHVFHTGSPNTARLPRQMLGKAVMACAR